MDCYADPVPEIDALVMALANSRRRVCIRFLADTEPAPLADIADAISLIEQDGDGVDSQTRKSIYNSLNQSHAPVLVRTNIATIDTQQKELHKGPQFNRCYTILECIDDVRR